MVSVDVGAQRQLSTDEAGGNAEKESDAGDGNAKEKHTLILVV